MLTVLKETPITCDGVDYLEQLVRNSECVPGDACGLCFYNGYVPSEGLLADCMSVHGCTPSCKTYFKVKPL